MPGVPAAGSDLGRFLVRRFRPARIGPGRAPQRARRPPVERRESPPGNRLARASRKSHLSLASPGAEIGERDTRSYSGALPQRLSKKPASGSMGATAGSSSSELSGISPHTAGQASSGTLFRQIGKTAPATCCYEVTGEQYRASLDSVAIDGAAGSVRRADVALAWQSDGSLRGAAVLEVEPGGVAERTLRLPDGCELIQATVNGMTTSPRRAGDNLWRLSLPSADEVQQLEVVYRGRVTGADRSDRVRFDAPLLTDAPVQQIRWIIAAPADRLLSDPQGAAVAGPWQPADILRRAISGLHPTVNQYASADGETRLSLACRTVSRNQLPRYLAGAVALAAFALLGFTVLSRGKNGKSP